MAISQSRVEMKGTRREVLHETVQSPPKQTEKQINTSRFVKSSSLDSQAVREKNMLQKDSGGKTVKSCQKSMP
jgi:hypothetical protein|tara:strand:+ start:300 stop:518 length:219 start_codon:yes stop_codon:yes gene_type:complete